MSHGLKTLIFNGTNENDKKLFEIKSDSTKIFSDHGYAPNVISPSFPYGEKTEKNGDDASGFTCKIDTSKPCMTKAAIYNYLPNVKVKKEYTGDGEQVEICWPPFPVMAGMKSAQLVVDTHGFPVMTRESFDAVLNYSTDQEDYYKQAGNMPYLTSWDTELPAAELSCIQPFFFNWNPFPLYYSQNVPVNIIYKWDRKLLNLIRMRYRKNESEHWHDIKPKFKYLVNVTKDTTIGTPDLWVNYDVVNQETIATEQQCFPEGDGVMEIRNFKTPYSFEATNVAVYGDKSEIAVEINDMCLAIFVMCQNETASRYNNKPNYTTDSDTTAKGFCPIHALSVDHKGTSHFKDVPPSILYQLYRDRFDVTPKDPNIIAIPLCRKVFSSDIEFGPNCSKIGTKIKIQVENGNIFERKHESEDSDEESDDDEEIVNKPRAKRYPFKCHAVALVNQSYSIERKGSNYSINFNINKDS